MINLFARLRKLGVGNYFPRPHGIFRAFQIGDLDKVRVVILGQDPYHTPGYANGLAFAVNVGIIVKPPSLANIFKEVERSIQERIDRCESNLIGWAEQGVLLLNTVLTVEPGKPLSHAGLGWERFTDAAICALSAQERPIVFMLWGAEARAKAQMIDPRHLILEATHPSPNGCNSGPESSRFTGCRHFLKANEFFERRKENAIIWRRT